MRNLGQPVVDLVNGPTHMHILIILDQAKCARSMKVRQGRVRKRPKAER
jgi:hypothetical protein